MSRLTPEERQNVRIAKGAVKSKGGLGQVMSEVLIKIIERLEREASIQPETVKKQKRGFSITTEDPMDESGDPDA